MAGLDPLPWPLEYQRLVTIFLRVKNSICRGRWKCRPDDPVDGLVGHRVGRHDHVVLGPAERLNALPAFAARS